MAELSLRAPTTADLPRLAAAAAHHLGPEQASRLTRLLSANPERARSRVLLQGDRVLAHVAAAALPYLVRSQPRTFGRLTGVFVEPALRLRGVHGVLADLLQDLFASCDGEGGMSLLTARCVDGDAWWMRRHGGFEPVATGLTLCRLDDRRIGVPEGLAVQRFGAAQDGAWPTTPSDTQCALVRDSAWAQNVVADDPALEVHFATRDGVAVGSVVVRAVEGERHLLDMASPTGDWHAALALLSAVVGDARLPVRCTLWNPSHWTAQALQEAGFSLAVAQPEPLLLARPRLGFLTRHFLAEHQELFELVAGESVLPTFTRGELVVTPPPAGDRGNAS